MQAPPLPLVRSRKPERFWSAAALLAEALVFMLAARVTLRLIPVRRIIARQQRPVMAQRPSPECAAQTIAEVAWAVAAATRRSPVLLVCFPQALAASRMLRTRGVPTRLHSGAARIDGKLEMHVWLEAQGQIVTGGEEAHQFSTLAVF